MKRITPIFRRSRARKGKTGFFVEEGVAYDDSCSPAFLFMAGERIKVKPDKILVKSMVTT